MSSGFHRLGSPRNGLSLDAAKMLMTHVTRQRHKCQYCRGDVEPGVSNCEICGAANMDW